MIKTFIGLLLLLQFATANTALITGKWHDATRILNNGQETIEKSYLTLNPNGMFYILILVSVKKGDAFIKDLRVEIAGTWKVQDGVLKYVIKNVNIPSVKEVYLISQQSLDNLANVFKNTYTNNSVHVRKIELLDEKNMILVNEKGKKSTYKR
jgi:hypothetical protein